MTYYVDVPAVSAWKNDTSTLRKMAGGSTVERLDADIELYHQAFSSMAKRNLLTDLQRSMAAWERLHGFTVANHPVCMAFKGVVARKLAEVTPSAFPYTHVICAGWCIGCNTNLGKDYFKFTDKDSGDLRGKCAEMMHAIASASDAIALGGIADTEKTLKIFMAPEFYFRGKNGAYTPDLVSSIIPSMRELGTDSDAYKHWLFVFGTAVSAHEDTVHFCTVCNSTNVKFVPHPTQGGKTVGQCNVDPSHAVVEGNYGAEVQNVALIQKGSDAHLVAKEYVSGIDYKQGKVNVQYGKKGGAQVLNAKAPAGSANSRIKSTFDDERMGGCILTVDGITVGLEVCLDHAHTKATPMSGGRLAKYADKIQLQLIPSYGMDIRNGLYCMKNGVVFNVDGRNNGTSEVVVKGQNAPQVKQTAGTRKARGSIDLWGPFPIPRHAR